MSLLSEKQIGLIFAILRVLQWLSAAIVMGISSYFISVGPRHQHALYWEILVSFDRVNLPLKYSEIDSAVGDIRCYILLRLRTVVPPVSEYGKIYMGILCGFYH